MKFRLIKEHKRNGNSTSLSPRFLYHHLTLCFWQAEERCDSRVQTSRSFANSCRAVVLKVQSWGEAAASLGHLFKVQILGPSPRPTEPETLGWGPIICVLSSSPAPGWVNHCGHRFWVIIATMCLHHSPLSASASACGVRAGTCLNGPGSPGLSQTRSSGSVC